MEIFAFNDAVGWKLVKVGAAPITPHTHSLGRDEFSSDPPFHKLENNLFNAFKVHLDYEFLVHEQSKK